MFQKIVYNCTIQLYKYLTHFVALFNNKAKQRIEGLRNDNAVLANIANEKNQSKNWQLAWFHAASLGEFEQARPVLEQFKRTQPDYKVLVTFFSPSGFEIRKNYPLADYVLYLPFDLSADVERFIDSIQPTIVFWVKYEYWRNFLRILSERNIPVFLFSAIFRENQPFFQWYGKFFTQPLRYFSHLFVQDEASKVLLNSIEITKVTVAGDTRFDRVADTLKSVRDIETVQRFKANRKLLVVGSAWEEDVTCINSILTSSPTISERDSFSIRVVIAPHELQEEQIERWKKQFNGIRYSEVNEETNFEDFDALIIDNIGLLASIYQYADFAFIGGGFGKGLHNILEAATFGMPIFFGNKSYQKFKEATDLIAFGGAFAVADDKGFVAEFQKQVLNNSDAVRITAEYVQQKTGASSIILTYLADEYSF